MSVKDLPQSTLIAHQCQPTTGTEIEAAILKTLKIKGTLHLASTNDHSNQQSYLFESENGYCLLIKKTPFHAYAETQQAESISKWLYEQGCCTPLLMDTIELNHNNERHHLWVYLYVQGQFCSPTPKDTHLVGEAIAHLHTCLKRNPQILTWRKNTLKKYQSLLERQQRLLSNEIKNEYLSDKIKNLFSELDLDYFQQNCPAPLHGQLMPKNMLITLDKNVCFFNFTQTASSFEHPILELAFVIDRLVLENVHREAEALALGSSLMESYYHAGGNCPVDLEDENCLRFLLLRDACELLERQENGIPVSKSAWNKLHNEIVRTEKQKLSLYRSILESLDRSNFER